MEFVFALWLFSLPSFCFVFNQMPLAVLSLLRAAWATSRHQNTHSRRVAEITVECNKSYITRRSSECEYMFNGMCEAFSLLPIFRRMYTSDLVGAGDLEFLRRWWSRRRTSIERNGLPGTFIVFLEFDVARPRDRSMVAAIGGAEREGWRRQTRSAAASRILIDWHPLKRAPEECLVASFVERTVVAAAAATATAADRVFQIFFFFFFVDSAVFFLLFFFFRLEEHDPSLVIPHQARRFQDARLPAVLARLSENGETGPRWIHHVRYAPDNSDLLAKQKMSTFYFGEYIIQLSLSFLF